MEYQTLREKYPLMIYHDYHIEHDHNTLQITYDFEIVGLTHFYPKYQIPFDGYLNDKPQLAQLVFHIGMIELISYWKTCCCPKVIIQAGYLDKAQLAFFKKLYFHGLGEFFYQNHIEITMEEMMEISVQHEMESHHYPKITTKGNLIPVGGGKDSFVTLDLLKNEKDNHAFIINPIISAIHSVQASGYQDRYIQVYRQLDPVLLEKNAQGFLNGHTPFSAMAAFVSYLVAYLYEKKYICLSNEDSANESTIQGSTVNHQYSKSFMFEQDFVEYTTTYFQQDIHYFSLLRPLSELQIAAIFSKLDAYLPVFRSCNVGQKQGVWCGHCAKCLFVCVMLSGFIEHSKLCQIFGRDMLNDPEMIELFDQLVGISTNKPFECVGTRLEVNQAIQLALAHGYQTVLYDHYQKSEFYTYYRNTQVDFQKIQPHHLVPKAYLHLIQERLANL